MSIFFIFELLGAVPVYCAGLEKRRKFGVRMTASVLGSALISACTLSAAWNSAAADRMVIPATAAIIIFMFFMLVIIIWIPFHISFQEALYCATCAYLTEHMAYSIRLMINGAAGPGTADAGTALYFFIHITVSLLFYVIFARKMIRHKHYSTSAVQSLGLMVSVLFLVLFMSILASRYHFEMLHGIYALFCGIVVMYSQLKQQKELKTQEELNVQQQLWLRHKAQYEMSRENIDIINGKCHDLKHQIAALKTIDNIEKQRQAIDAIEDSVMIYDSMLQTGNTILDTVLTEKSLLCNKQRIALTCIVDGKLLFFMDAVDLYTFFGNALDNAMEGVSSLEEEDRLISLRVSKKADLIQIQIENKYQGEIAMQDGFPVTGKPDKNFHGFGVKSMSRIVQKYNGFVTIETNHGIFLLRVTIPAEQSTT